MPETVSRLLGELLAGSHDGLVAPIPISYRIWHNLQLSGSLGTLGAGLGATFTDSACYAPQCECRPPARVFMGECHFFGAPSSAALFDATNTDSTIGSDKAAVFDHLITGYLTLPRRYARR
jgi:hypothetical protein